MTSPGPSQGSRAEAGRKARPGATQPTGSRPSTAQRGNRAAIDMGSSSFKLLVTDARGATLHDEKMSVGIGVGGEARRLLPKAGQERGEHVLRHFIAVASTFGIEAADIRAVATAAMRNADGKQSAATRRDGMATGRGFMQRSVRQKLGLRGARLLSGAEEANWGFRGAIAAMSLAEGQRVAVLDTGGGSHQLTVGTARGIEHDGSTQVGSNAVMAQAFRRADGSVMEAMSAADFDAVDRALVGLVPALPIDRDHLAGANLVTIGGTAKYLRHHFRKAAVSRRELDALRRKLGTLGFADRGSAAARDTNGQPFGPAERQLLGLQEDGVKPGATYGAKLPAKISLLLRLMDLMQIDTLDLSVSDTRHALVADHD